MGTSLIHTQNLGSGKSYFTDLVKIFIPAVQIFVFHKDSENGLQTRKYESIISFGKDLFLTIINKLG